MRLASSLIAFLVLVLIAYSCFLGHNIYQRQQDISNLKEHYAEINKVNYGLFNMQEWKIKAFNVFNGHIDQFNISPSALQEAEEELRKYLYSIYDNYVASGIIFQKIFEDAEKNTKVNKAILKLFKDNLQTQIDALDIKNHIPQMASQLAAELKNNEPRFREIMQSELRNLLQYKDKYTFVDPRINIYKQYHCTDLSCTNTIIKQKLNSISSIQSREITNICILILAILVVVSSTYKLTGINFLTAIFTLISLILLILGINLPMIVIDARMNSFVFNLFEQDLNFGEQVVFYQSKSILDVTKTLIESRGLDLKIVGIMILCFSVIFPVIKLILSTLFMQFKSVKESSIARGMIFYLGKWSMADVFVVALFMAYIGFFGLFNAQLDALETNKGGFAIETVNYTYLAAGALFFTAYCILSIVLGIIVNKYHKEN